MEGCYIYGRQGAGEGSIQQGCMNDCVGVHMYVCKWHMKEKPAIKGYPVCMWQGEGKVLEDVWKKEKECVLCVYLPQYTEAEGKGGCFWRCVWRRR